LAKATQSTAIVSSLFVSIQCIGYKRVFYLILLL
jgi:hypothetical protein